MKKLIILLSGLFLGYILITKRYTEKEIDEDYWSDDENQPTHI